MKKIKDCNFTIDTIIKISELGVKAKDRLTLLSFSCKFFEKDEYLKVCIVSIEKRHFSVVTKDKIEPLNKYEESFLNSVSKATVDKKIIITKSLIKDEEKESIFIPIISPINFDIFGIISITSKETFKNFEIEHLNMCSKSLAYSIYNLNTKILKDKIENKLVTLNENLAKRVEEETEKKLEKERLLIQQSKLAVMGEMIGNIAHQWRQPLNALGLVLQNMKLFYDREKLTKEMMENLSNNGMDLIDKMSITISDFMNFFKPKSDREVFLLKDSILKTVKLMESSLKHHDISINIDIDENLMVEGYSNEFSQVILNLLSNSKDAFGEKEIEDKTIIIKAKTDKFTILTFSDNAGGIDEAILDRIFEPYFSTKEEGKGSGIGLYMSKMILENMNASIEVFNENSGVTFKIILK